MKNLCKEYLFSINYHTFQPDLPPMKALKNILSGKRDFNQYIRLSVFALAIPLLYSACDDKNLFSQTRDLQVAKEQWDRSNIKNYRVEIERVCFCPPPIQYTMVVENGEIAQIIDSETGEAIQHLTGYSTIDELFTWLEQASAQDPQKLELEFHPQLGYPTYIDYNQSDMIADEEMLMRLNDLKKN